MLADKHTQYTNGNVKQRPYIPHFHVHADTLEEVFIFD